MHEIDLEANKMLETIIPRLTTERGIDESLKARDMLRWVAEMNNVKASAEEIILQGIVYQ
ncbi:MAG: TnpV protein [Ruminococcaceae bacterium]|nr:TnpV protein [Oscillospiraceae bacterium]